MMKLVTQSRKTPASPSREAGEEFVRLPRGEDLLSASREMEVEHLEGLITNPTVRSPERRTLQVTDNSMSGADIRAGDFVIVQNRKDYSDGTIVAVQLGDQQLIRRYFYRSGRIHLECDPPRNQLLIVEKNTPDFQILGQVIQIIREIK
jgi:SOS-response transcriptional repressor LexA